MRKQSQGTSSFWSCPTASSAIDATITLPSSKSASARALILGACVQGSVTLGGVLKCDDTITLQRGLQGLGATFRALDETTLQVDGSLNSGKPAEFNIDCGIAGTAMRFLPALAAALGAAGTLDCDDRAAHRPMEGLLDALRQLGAQIVSTNGHFPLVFGKNTGRTRNEAVTVDAAASSQFISALLLCSVLLPAPLEVIAVENPPSAPYLQLTAEMLRDFKVPCEKTGKRTWKAGGKRPSLRSYEVPADLASAAPFIVAVILLGGELIVTNWPKATETYQAFWDGLVRHFGGSITESSDTSQVARIHCPIGLLNAETNYPPLDLDMNGYGELVPAVAAVAALACPGTALRGIGHLRGHETDRLQALCEEIEATGGEARIVAEDLFIDSVARVPASFRSYGDHRMAMFAALMGLGLPGSTLDDITVTTKTMPEFASQWEAFLSAPIKQESRL